MNAFGDDKLDESIDYYKKALRSIPITGCTPRLGMALFNRGRVEEAIAAAKKLIEIDNDDILAHTSLSMFYQSQGQNRRRRKRGECGPNSGLETRTSGKSGHATNTNSL